MKKGKLRRVLVILFIAVGVIVVGLVAAYMGLVDLIDRITDEHRQMAPVDLSLVPDGVYDGKAGGFICSVDLDVTVKDHRIEGITVNRQVNGGGLYEAADMIPRILEAQTPDVDVVTGATLTSKTIEVAVYRALTGN